MKWLFERLNEPSTHAALAGVTAAVLPLVPPQYQIFVQCLAGLFGLTGFAKKG